MQVNMEKVAETVYDAVSGVFGQNEVVDVFVGQEPLTIEVVQVMHIVTMAMLPLTFQPVLNILAGFGLFVIISEAYGSTPDEDEDGQAIFGEEAESVPWIMVNLTLTIAFTRPNNLS